VRWIGLLTIGLALLSVALFVSPVSAETSDMVLIKCTGYVCEAPGGFTVTYISDYEVGLSWTKGADAENTMVRGAIGREPTSRTDGWEVYYGEGTYATSWVNMEFLSEKVYYKAWSQNADGVWEEGGSATGFVEGITIMLLAFIGMALGLMIAAYFARRRVLAFAAGGAWILVSAFSYTKVLSEWDIYYILFWLSAGFGIISFFEVFALRERREEGEEPEEEDEEAEAFNEEMEIEERERRRYSTLFGRKKRAPRRRVSRFEKTGEL
jgi:hypothetical protein